MTRPPWRPCGSDVDWSVGIDRCPRNSGMHWSAHHHHHILLERRNIKLRNTNQDIADALCHSRHHHHRMVRFPPTQPEVACPAAMGAQPRRVLLYCLQDSGCTLFAMALAQLPSTLVVPDLWINSRTPCPQDFRSSFLQKHPNGSIVVKMTVRANDMPDLDPQKVNDQAVQRFDAIRARFQPDTVLFFARDIYCYRSNCSSPRFARLWSGGGHSAPSSLVSGCTCST